MARAVTTTIPIVFVAGEAPVTLGLMTSLAPAKLLPAGSGRKFEVLDASTSQEIDGAFATAFFFANRPTHSSWAATRFSDAGNNDLTTHTEHLKDGS